MEKNREKQLKTLKSGTYKEKNRGNTLHFHIYTIYKTFFLVVIHVSAA